MTTENKTSSNVSSDIPVNLETDKFVIFSCKKDTPWLTQNLHTSTLLAVVRPDGDIIPLLKVSKGWDPETTLQSQIRFLLGGAPTTHFQIESLNNLKTKSMQFTGYYISYKSALWLCRHVYEIANDTLMQDKKNNPDAVKSLKEAKQSLKAAKQSLKAAEQSLTEVKQPLRCAEKTVKTRRVAVRNEEATVDAAKSVRAKAAQDVLYYESYMPHKVKDEADSTNIVFKIVDIEKYKLDGIFNNVESRDSTKNIDKLNKLKKSYKYSSRQYPCGKTTKTLIELTRNIESLSNFTPSNCYTPFPNKGIITDPTALYYTARIQPNKKLQKSCDPKENLKYALELKLYRRLEDLKRKGRGLSLTKKKTDLVNKLFDEFDQLPPIAAEGATNQMYNYDALRQYRTNSWKFINRRKNENSKLIKQRRTPVLLPGVASTIWHSAINPLWWFQSRPKTSTEKMFDELLDMLDFAIPELHYSNRAAVQKSLSSSPLKRHLLNEIAQRVGEYRMKDKSSENTRNKANILEKVYCQITSASTNKQFSTILKTLGNGNTYTGDAAAIATAKNKTAIGKFRAPTLFSKIIQRTMFARKTTTEKMFKRLEVVVDKAVEQDKRQNKRSTEQVTP